MPHNWASAEFIRLVRDLLVLERGDELHLLEGLPRAWVRPGGEVRFREVPTTFGPIDLKLTVSSDGKSARIEVGPPKREPPAKIVVHTEHFGRPVKEVRLDGKELSGASVPIPVDRAAVIEVVFEK